LPRTGFATGVHPQDVSRRVLRRFFGTDNVGYTFTAAGITRSYARLSEAAAESVDARVVCGNPFPHGMRAGCAPGQVGRFAIQHFLKPVRTKGNR